MNDNVALDLKDAFIEHRNDFGVTITHNGNDYQAIIAESEYTRTLVMGGFSDDGDIRIKLLRSDLYLEIGNLITYNAIQFKISGRSVMNNSDIVEYSAKPIRR